MTKISYAGYRFPPEIIHQSIWLYLRFTLSFRDVEDLLAERGSEVSYETVRRWVNRFGPLIAAQLRRRRPRPHTIWHLDEAYQKVDGRMVYLWRNRLIEAVPRHCSRSTPAVTSIASNRASHDISSLRHQPMTDVLFDRECELRIRGTDLTANENLLA